MHAGRRISNWAGSAHSAGFVLCETNIDALMPEHADAVTTRRSMPPPYQLAMGAEHVLLSCAATAALGALAIQGERPRAQLLTSVFQVAGRPSSSPPDFARQCAKAAVVLQQRLGSAPGMERRRQRRRTVGRHQPCQLLRQQLFEFRRRGVRQRQAMLPEQRLPLAAAQRFICRAPLRRARDGGSAECAIMNPWTTAM